MDSAGKKIEKSLEKKIKDKNSQKYVLRLYVAGMSPKSVKAIDNLNRLCQENLEGRYELDIIDLYQSPIFAKDGQIIAAPTLIKELPEPIRRFVGDMSNTEKLIVGLDLEKSE
jgi:circadian clock protein KaiB